LAKTSPGLPPHRTSWRRKASIDDLMKKTMDPESPYHQLSVGFDVFKARRGAKLTCVIRDHTYGAMQVYLVPPLVLPR
jgi:hypothetical protein